MMTPLLAIIACCCCCLQLGTARPDCCPKTAQPAAPVSDTTKRTEPDSLQAWHTCPMHEDIRRAEPGKCPKCGMTLVKTTVLRDSTAKDSTKAPAEKPASSTPTTSTTPVPVQPSHNH